MQCQNNDPGVGDCPTPARWIVRWNNTRGTTIACCDRHIQWYRCNPSRRDPWDIRPV